MLPFKDKKLGRYYDKMRDYRKITIWENRKRIDFLVNFKNLVIDYFKNVKRANWELGLIENETAKQKREKINLVLHKAHSIILTAEVYPYLTYIPPRAVGGYIQKIDLVLDIFHLSNYRINPQEVVDILDKAIGVYENDRHDSLLRTINPLFWIDLILSYIVSFLFRIIGGMGFDQEKIKSPIIGKIIKGILYLIIVFASFLTILQKLGYLEKFRLLIQGWLK